jgi:hypothetical protein
MSDPYEREAAKAAIKVLQRELAEAKEKATTAWSDNLILDSRNRQLERELSDMTQRRDELLASLEKVIKYLTISLPSSDE